VLVAALSLLTGASAAGQSLPPLPKLPLDTYEPGIREPITQADEAVRRAPRDPERNGALGMLLYANEQYELAETCFARAHALAPAEARWAYALGRSQVYLARYDRAIASLEEALRREPGSLPARLMLAKALLEGGRPEESQTVYRKVVGDHPDAAEAHYGLGRIAAARGETNVAIEHLRKACALFSGFGAAHYALARAYRETGDEAKAREHLALYQENKLGWPSSASPARRRSTTEPPSPSTPTSPSSTTISAYSFPGRGGTARRSRSFGRRSNSTPSTPTPRTTSPTSS
jgi:tetratricopeptide (TPR) repeat protein